MIEEWEPIASAKKTEPILVCSEGKKGVAIAAWLGHHKSGRWFGAGVSFLEPITHWQRLPRPKPRQQGVKR